MKISKLPRPRLTFANATAAACLFIVAGGPGATVNVADHLIGSHGILDNSIRGRDIHNGTITGADVRNHSLTAADFRGSVKGARGAVGPQGPVGPVGPQGETGPTGATGATGRSGSNGADGKSAYELAVADGFSGTQAEWLASLIGPAGVDGTDGHDGAPGAPGADGADGNEGAPGAQGVPGEPGKDGTNGTDGKSAYQIAVANGFSGTQAQWLTSLKGDKGDPGPVYEAAGAVNADGTSQLNTSHFESSFDGNQYMLRFPRAGFPTDPPVVTVTPLGHATVGNMSLTYDSSSTSWVEKFDLSTPMPFNFTALPASN